MAVHGSPQGGEDNTLFLEALVEIDVEDDAVDLPDMPRCRTIGRHGSLKAIGTGAEVVGTLGEFRPGQRGQIEFLLQVGIAPLFQLGGGHGRLLINLPCLHPALLEPGRLGS